MVGLLAVLMVMAFASSSFAQINITAFGNGSPEEIKTNVTADTFDPTSTGSGLLISGANIAPAALGTTTNLIINYGTQITSSTQAGGNAGSTVPTGYPIQISGASGAFANVFISSINYVTGQIIITLSSGSSTAAVSSGGTFTLTGVRVNANGLTSPVNATISLSSSANNFILSTSSVTVITALKDGIASAAIGPRLSSTVSTGTFQLLSTGTIADSSAVFTLTEGGSNLWRNASQDPGAQNNTQFRLTFAGIPNGVTLSLTGNSSSSSSGTISFSPSSITASALTTTVSFNGLWNPAAVDKVEINVSASVNGTVTSLATGAITVTASMAPISTKVLSLDTDAGGKNLPIADTGVPRFVAAETTTLTLGSIVGALQRS